MSATVSPPMDWIRRIERTLDVRPLLAAPFGVELEKAGEALTNRLQRGQVRIERSAWEWRESGALVPGAGYLTRAIQCPPLDGAIYWSVTEQDRLSAIAFLLDCPVGELGGLDSLLLEGVEVACLNVALEALQESGWPSDLILHDGGQAAALPTEACLCSDVTVHIGSLKLWGRLILPGAVMEAWKRHCAQPASWNLEQLGALPVTVELEMGRTALTASDLREVKEGDWIVLDRCSARPKQNKWTILVGVQGHPLFRARFKDEKLKIDDYLLDEEPMATPNEPQPVTPEPTPEPSLEPAAEAAVSEEAILVEAAPEAEKAPETAPSTGPISLDKIPVTLVVEVGRLQMSAKELLSLQPGNLLELETRPEQPVDLVINGSSVGKGELVQVGEVVGVRVLQWLHGGK
jgi:flagellar motor switch protein FliN